MAHVVEKLEIALEFQEIYEEVEQPMDYEEMIKTAVPPLIYRSEEELKMLLYKGVLLNGGKTWFSLNKNGEHCEMISVAECLTGIASRSPFMDRYQLMSGEISRFADSYQAFDRDFKTHVRTQFLSPQITYTVNLVFQFMYTKAALSGPTYFALKYKLEGEKKSSISYLAYGREDGWLMAELYQFTSNRRKVDLEILFGGPVLAFHPFQIVVEGIEFRPLEKVKHKVLEDEKVDMQPISDSDTDWEQKLPNDFEEIIQWSKDSMQWTTKKELNFLLCKGFLINNGEEWFSLAKNGKKCHMLPARAALAKHMWSWVSQRESRFEEVAFNPIGNVSIVCKIRSQILSPQTTYATYLVYKLPENHHSVFEAPVKVKDKDFHLMDSEVTDIQIIYLLGPQTPVIRGMVYRNTHNPMNRPKMKGIPKPRDDGWMEVQVWGFQTGTTTKMISMRVDLTTFSYERLVGLTVQGIEFKPI